MCSYEEAQDAFSSIVQSGLLRGEITEDGYLRWLIHERQWQVDPEVLKAVIRQNFHKTVPNVWTYPDKMEYGGVSS